MTYFIYVVENLINGKMYVGQTLDLARRMSNHLSSSSNCRYFKRALDKYKPDNFEFSIIEKCESDDDINEREKYWIKELNSLAPNGYNLKEGGEKAVRVCEE